MFVILKYYILKYQVERNRDVLQEYERPHRAKPPARSPEPRTGDCERPDEHHAGGSDADSQALSV